MALLIDPTPKLYPLQEYYSRQKGELLLRSWGVKRLPSKLKVGNSL